MAKGRRPIPDIERFMALTIPEPNSGCILWDGATKSSSSDGSELRGVFSLNGRHVKAHRASWMLHCGVIPAGMMVCHHCDVTLCVNPKHLFLGDAAANRMDCLMKGRDNNPKSRLSPERACEIRAADGGLSQLAETFGVNVTTIHRIKTRRTWRHLP